MSPSVVARPRSRSSSSESLDELVIPFDHSGLLEVGASCLTVRLRESEKVLNVRKILELSRGIVAHGLHLHRHEVLWARDGRLALSQGEGASAR